MKRKLRRVMAYVYMPLLLSLIGFLIVMFCFSPYIKTAYSLMSIFSKSTGESVVDDKKTLELAYEYTDEDALRERGQSETDASQESGQSEADDQPLSIPYSSSMRPGIGQLYAQMHCDRLGIHENVYYGDGSEQLNMGIGQYAGSAIFGFGRPVLLGGHHSTSFAPLEYVEVGDVFTVITSYGKYRYEVYDIRVASQYDETAWGLDKEEEIVTMYTCYPFTPLSSYTDRLYVYAKKISGPYLVH